MHKDKQGPGRPPASETDRKTSPRVSISLEQSAYEAVLKAQEQLQQELGFKPTLSQTIAWAVRGKQHG